VTEKKEIFPILPHYPGHNGIWTWAQWVTNYWSSSQIRTVSSSSLSKLAHAKCAIYYRSYKNTSFHWTWSIMAIQADYVFIFEFSSISVPILFRFFGSVLFSLVLFPFFVKIRFFNFFHTFGYTPLCPTHSAPMYRSRLRGFYGRLYLMDSSDY
jgi:hypothetical protein